MNSFLQKIPKLKYLIIFLIVAYFVVAFFPAQAVNTWQTVPGLYEIGRGGYNTIEFSSTNVPYTAYMDTQNGRRVTVESFDGATWTPVGAAGFSSGTSSDVDLQIASDNTLYVGYRDQDFNNRMTVKSWNGSTWTTVGSEGFTALTALNSIFRLAPDNTPYVFYRGNPGVDPYVMRWTGATWTSVGGFFHEGNSIGDSFDLAFTADSTPYIVYDNVGGSNGLTVKSWTGATWTPVGAINFSDPNFFQQIEIASDDTIYVAYGDGDNSNYASVKTWTGATWSLVGTAGFTGVTIADNSADFDLDSNDTPHMSYRTTGNNIAVRSWNGSSWALVGDEDFSPGGVNYSDLAFDSNDTPYVVYSAQLQSQVVVYKYADDGSSDNNNGGLPTYYVDPPQCTFNAPEHIIDGEPLELNWSHSWPGQFTSPYYYKLNGVLYPAGSSGLTIYPEDSLYPSPSQDFQFDAINIYGATICNQTVELVQELTCDAQVEPEEVLLGQEVELSWEVSGGLPPYESPDGENFESPVTITPEETGEYTYQIAIADQSEQQAFCEASFEVMEPEPEIVLQPLTCDLFAAPNEVEEGGSSQLLWNIFGGQSPYLTYLRQEPVEDSFVISAPYTVAPTQTTEYEVAVLDDNGEIANCGTVVEVDVSEPEITPQPETTPELQPTPPPTITPQPPTTPPTPSPDSPLIQPDPITPEPQPEPQQPTPPTQEQPTQPQSITFRTVDIANFVSQPETQVGIMAALALGIITALANAFATPLAGSELLLLPARLWNLFLTALGIRKREERQWGTVFNAKTKEPLDPVHVVLTNTQTGETKTAITDMDGRYSFLVDTPGTYRLTANKNQYTFPSAHLQGKEQDHLYKNLYHGEPFQVTEGGQVITKNIPLDPTTVNWNEQDKLNNNRLKFYKKRDYILTKAANTLFYLGFALAVLATIFFPAPFNIATLALYVIFYLIKKTGYGGRKTGSITDTQGNPIPHAILRLISPTLNQEIKHTVADKYGRYHLLANNGTYNLTVEERVNDEVARGVNTQATITKGYYREDVEI